MLPHKISQSSFPIICHPDPVSFALKAGRHRNKVQTEFPVNKLRPCLRLKTSLQINISQGRTRRWLSFSWASNTLEQTHQPPTPIHHSAHAVQSTAVMQPAFKTAVWVQGVIPKSRRPSIPSCTGEEVKRHRGEDEIPGMKSGFISNSMYLRLCLTFCSASTCNHSTRRWRFYFNVHLCDIKSNALL